MGRPPSGGSERSPGAGGPVHPRASVGQEDAETQRARAITLDVVKAWKVEGYTWFSKLLGREAGTKLGSERFQFDVVFSEPQQTRPVPMAVVNVYFTVDFPRAGAEPAVSYRFEHETTRHHWPHRTLAPGKFEAWIDRILRNKAIVRQVHDLSTDFEHSRLPAPADELAETDSDSAVELVEEQAPAAAVFLTEQAENLEDTLSNVFDAADETHEGLLSHKEVAELLYATKLDLTDWEIKLLLTHATEDARGFIAYSDFVRCAPATIAALRERRKHFEARRVEKVEVTVDAVEVCCGEEVDDTVKQVKELFDAAAVDADAQLMRSQFRECLLAKPERFAPQEVRLLMQMVKEDDYGRVNHEDFQQLLVQLRIDALHNAMVETDAEALQQHLLSVLQRLAPSETEVDVWTLKQVLLQQDQLLLSRMHIHVLLCLLRPNEHGYVDVEFFLKVAARIIPRLFDAPGFMEQYATIAKEKADAQAKAELEELEEFAGRAQAKAEEDNEEDEKAPDREAVEKALVQQCQAEAHKEKAAFSTGQQITLQNFMAAMRHEQSRQQLSEPEMRGFIAEVSLDRVTGEDGHVSEVLNYGEHIKTWVPLIFLLRRSRIYEQLLSQDWTPDPEDLDSGKRVRTSQGME